MDDTVWLDDDLWTNGWSSIHEINPNQDFNGQQENADLGPRQHLNPQQETAEPELLPRHVETNEGHQLNKTVEPSPEPSRRGRKAKLSESQRKLNKKLSDEKYRQKLRDNLAHLKKEKEKMEKQLGEIKSEKEDLLKHTQYLEELIKELRSQRDVWMTDVQGESVDANKMITEWLSREPFNATVPAAAAEFVRKLEENKKSKIDFKDFAELHEKPEYRTVGEYQIPLSLVPTAEKITEVYGDVCATSTISQNFAENIYILFCATIKEMDELPLEKVTGETMLKWGVAIKNALCIKFKVEFALKHLKQTIACRYFGMKASKEAEKIDDDILKVEACLNGLKESKQFIDLAKEFDGKPFSEGLWG